MQPKPLPTRLDFPWEKWATHGLDHTARWVRSYPYPRMGNAAEKSGGSCRDTVAAGWSNGRP
jgi:hypothetical protein